MLSRCQNNYFDKIIKIDAIKECIFRPREYEFIKYLSDIGFKLNKHYVHQFACCQEEMGLIAVADFAFPNEKIVIELDGKNHNNKNQKRADDRRNKTFMANDYMVIRIKVPMDNYDKTFYKHIIKDTYDERNKLWQEGKVVKGGRICKTYREEQTTSLS